MSTTNDHWRRMAECYFENWRQAEAELERVSTEGNAESINMPSYGSGGDFYRLAVYWIVKERAGAGGWPPCDVSKVSGWTVVRLVADVFGREHADVARDVIHTASGTANGQR